jgi:hypothetical protein
MEPKDKVLEAINAQCQRISKISGAAISVGRPRRAFDQFTVLVDGEIAIQDRAANVDQYLAGVCLGLALARKDAVHRAEAELAKLKVQL